MRSPQRSTELPCPRRAEESDKKTSICAISASSSSFLIKGNSREDSLTVTLPGTTDGYKFAYAISMGNCEIRNCSVDIMVIGGMQNAGDNIAIRVSRKTTDFRLLKAKNNPRVPPTHTLLRVGGTFLALWITFFVRIVAQDLRLAGGLASF